MAAIQGGDVIAGRYRLHSLIGEGGMASVWRAQDQTLKRSVAIKLLHVRGHRDPQVIIDQFLREARIAASVQHRNVIHTVDFGVADSELPYMVMELLSGESLHERMHRDPPLRMEEVVHIAAVTLRGLIAVHEAGIVHRDLKPQNIFLHRDVDTVYPKILDFGISRSLGQEDRPSAISTQEGMIVGTPDYMSPEQARGETTIDKRADIYSLGAIVYEGITGRLPYQADTIGDLIVKIVTTEPPRIRDVRPDVPELLSDCIAQAMAHSREERFIDATVFRRALTAAAEKCFAPGAARPAPAPEAKAAALPAAPAPKAGWGEFEGIDARSGKPVVAPSGGAEPTPLQLPLPDPVAESAAAISFGARAPTPLKGSSPLDAIGVSGASAALELDYERGAGSRARAAGRGEPGRPHTGARARRVGRAVPIERGRRRGTRPSAVWLLPLLLLLLFAVLLFAPGLVATPVPDDARAAEAEQRNAATAGSARTFKNALRRDLGKLPPAQRDVVF